MRLRSALLVAALLPLAISLSDDEDKFDGVDNLQTPVYSGKLTVKYCMS